MISNPEISDSINQWGIEFDPYGFTTKVNWLEDAEKVEDILQLQHVCANGPILDLGFYNGVYRVVIVFGQDWDNPIELAESSSVKEIKQKIYTWLAKYENGV